MANKVGYVYSQELVDACNDLPRIRGRAAICAELIQSYELHEHLTMIEPRSLKFEELANFHSRDYLQTFKELCEADDPEKISKEVYDEYGLGYDCPVEEDLFERCSLIAGASVLAAESLINEQVNVAINWCGGWHHAKRFEASGFCYINDIVLAAQKLREKFERILYIDLDLHHGDGVEAAFYSTDKVFTFSLHKLSPGFFPGTGEMRDVGEARGVNHNLNIPLSDGISSEVYYEIFNSVYTKILEQYKPQSIIIQCGADGLAFDEMDSFNLSSDSLLSCVARVLMSEKPTLLLGGGGYNFPNTARLWTAITGLALSRELSRDIPSDSENFMMYKPDFELSVPAGNRKDENKPEHIERLVRMAHGCINRLAEDEDIHS